MCTSTHGPPQTVSTETRSTTWLSGPGFKRSVQDTRAHKGADVGSDHNLIITKVKRRLNITGKRQEGTARHEESRMRVPVVRQQFQIELRNKLSILQTTRTRMTTRTVSGRSSRNRTDIEQSCQEIKTAYTETALNVLGSRKSARAGSARKVGERSGTGGN